MGSCGRRRGSGAHPGKRPVPSKVNVNNLTVVHAGSSGVAPSFPDVCLTPAPPAPPIPIPYPNIAQSSDAAQGSPTVTVEGTR